MYRISRTLATLAATAIFAMSFGPAHAQGDYPDKKPIRLVVPFAPGGATDVLARTVAGSLGESFGSSVIVENKPGAGTVIAAEAVAKSPADGHTLLMATSTTLAINPSIYRKLPYDPVKDFVPVAMVATVPFVLVVNPALVPVGSLTELVAFVREKQLSYASAGKGTMHHLAAELFKSVTNLDLVHVPYRGSALAITDVVAGQVPMMFTDLAPAMPHIASGKLRAIAVTTTRRVASLPQVPTIAESGYPGFEAVAWQGVVAPAGTPRQVVELLGREIGRIVAKPAVEQRIAGAGMLANPMPTEALSAYVVAEIERWRPIVMASGAAEH